MDTLTGILKDIDKLQKKVNELSTKQLFQYTGWVSYAASSTVVGWTTFLTKNIYYCRIENLLYVTWEIVGTSNSTSTSFTLPKNNSSAPYQYFLHRAVDNSAAAVTGLGRLGTSTNVVTFYKDLASGSWTASGSKSTTGSALFYVV